MEAKNHILYILASLEEHWQIMTNDGCSFVKWVFDLIEGTEAVVCDVIISVALECF